MTDRERLIELVDKAKYEYANDITDHNETDYIVECLLDNGVIVPPCKVGDTIYKNILFKDGHGDCVPQKVVGFHLGEFPHIRGHERKQYIIVWHKVVNSISRIDIKQLGKTVFLTKEEAEQVLNAKA